jgi:predicted metalloprotease
MPEISMRAEAYARSSRLLDRFRGEAIPGMPVPVRFRKRARLDPTQVEDRRRLGGTGAAIGGGAGVVGVIVVLLVSLLGGGNIDLSALESLDGVSAGGGQQGEVIEECRTGEDANENRDCRLIATVNSIQAYWTERLDGYRTAVTVFFSGSTSTGCGAATSDVGPFYCPADEKVYVDLGFFEELQARFGAEGGPFAEAYVLAHEYGHHVQNLTGVLRGGGGQGPQSESVRIELQADCYAGVWAGNAVETGFLVSVTDDQIQQALDAAAAVGDDRIQQQTQGQVNREVWTHGSSTQRQRWFHTGYESADPNTCDTFSGPI